MFNRIFSVVIRKEDDMFVPFCPEIDIASQGNSVEEAKMNLKEALELFFENASENEIKSRIANEVYFTQTDTKLRLIIQYISK